MRTATMLGSIALAILVTAPTAACGDDDDTRAPAQSSLVPGPTNDDGETDGTSQTSLPAAGDPQSTPAPNPNAGGAGGGSTP